MDKPLRFLTPEEVSACDRDGAICARQVMPSGWIDRMAVAVERIIASPGAFGQQMSGQDQLELRAG